MSAVKLDSKGDDGLASGETLPEHVHGLTSPSNMKWNRTGASKSVEAGRRPYYGEEQFKTA